jgi:HAD superfamily hydrolase (TIGR01509 family)
MTYRAFVFDLDGTLVNSKIDFAAMRSELRLSQADDVLACIDALTDGFREAALDIVHKYERAGAHDASPIDGAREFIAHARRSGQPCAVFTRNANSLARECLQIHDFEVDLVVAREDAPPKPKPDGLFKIATSFGINANEMLFVGDYIYDLQSGLAAGVPTALFLPSPADFNTEGADFVFQSFGQLKDRVFLP